MEESKVTKGFLTSLNQEMAEIKNVTGGLFLHFEKLCEMLRD